MIQRTFGQVKYELARVSGTTGMPMTDDRIRLYLNQATEELMNEGDWPGVVDRYYFKTQNHHIILPYFLDRIMGIAINDRPYSMRSPWFEFVEYGPGPQNDNNCKWVDNVLDRGEVAIQAIFPNEANGPWNLFVEAEVQEGIVAGTSITPITITVQGTAPNSRQVRTMHGTSYGWGEQFELDPNPPYTTYGTAVFTGVTGVIKPNTNGYIKLWATNGNPASDTLLATYGPNETAPSYHAYFLPSLKDCLIGASACWTCCNSNTESSTVQNDGELRVLVRGRKRFIPILKDDDFLIITNLPALIAMMVAVIKREHSDPQGYAAYKLNAIDIMQKEAKSYRGSIRTPSITVMGGSTLGFMPYMR